LPTGNLSYLNIYGRPGRPPWIKRRLDPIFPTIFPIFPQEIMYLRAEPVSSPAGVPLRFTPAGDFIVPLGDPRKSSINFIRISKHNCNSHEFRFWQYIYTINSSDIRADF